RAIAGKGCPSRAQSAGTRRLSEAEDSRTREPPSGLAQLRDYELQVRQLRDSEADALPPHPAHLDSAERSVVPSKVRPVVDEHGARLHLPCELDATRQI